MLSRHEADAFRANIHDVESVQRRVLAEEVLPRLPTSGAGSFEDFRRTQPIVDYEAIRSEVDRAVRGEPCNLTTERCLAFFRTSGSVASPKLIPVTPTLVRQKSRAFGVFWQSVYADHPTLRDGTVIANFADSGGLDRTNAGIDILSETTFWNIRMRASQGRRRWRLPPELRSISSSAARYYAVCRLALGEPVHGFMCLNPSTLLMLCRTAEAHLDDLLKGLADGTWGTDEWADGLPDALQSDLRQDATWANTVRNAVDRAGRVRLRDIWPDLDLVICWRSNLVRPYLSQLEPYLEGVSARDYITQASECIMAIPLADHASGGVLAYTSHFFEFIPEEETESPNPAARCAWEVEEGRTYELVVTTGGGLSRYRMGDCVRITGFEGQVPRLEFLYRRGKTSSMTGEKLTEAHVTEAARQASKMAGGAPREYVCFPKSGALPHYAVLLHWPHAGTPRIARWLGAFDATLADVNSEYADKQHSGRLGPVSGILTSSSGFQFYRTRERDEGVSDEQLKVTVLTGKLDVDAGVPDTEIINAHS